MNWSLWLRNWGVITGGTAAAAGAQAVEMPAQLFTRISLLMLEPLIEMLERLVTHYEVVVQVVASGLLAIYLLYLIIAAMAGTRSASQVWWALGVSIVPYCLIMTQGATYEWVVETLLFAIPTWLTNGVTGLMRAGTVTLDSDGFGHVLSDALLMGADLWRSLGMTDFGGALLVALLLAAAILAIAYAWWIWFKAGMWLVLLLAISPVPLLCAIVPALRGIFTRWLDTIAGFIALKLVTVIFVALLLGAEGLLVGQFINAGENVIDKTIYLFCAVCVFVAFFLMSLDIPRIAASLGGGVIMHGNGMMGTGLFVAGYATRAWNAARPAPANP